MDQNPTSMPEPTVPTPPTEPYPHHDLPLEVPQPPAGPSAVVSPVAEQPAWSSPQPTYDAAPQPIAQPHPGWHKPHMKMPGFMQAASSAFDNAAAAPQYGSTPSVIPDMAQVPLSSSDPARPVPVVRVLSPVGVEYVFLTFTLFTGAIGLTSVLIALVNGKFDFDVLSFPAAVLLVSVPTFAWLFLYLKKQELLRPALKLDPSKRRSTQFSQIVSFAVCFFTLIGLVFAIFAKLGGQLDFSVFKAILDSLCVLVVAGGILTYYWRDEHKSY